MLNNSRKIRSKGNKDLYLSVIPGHFSSNRFHVNYYFDMTTLKMCQSEAEMVAKEMCKKYVNRIQLSCVNHSLFMFGMEHRYAHAELIDTIICMDGCEVIGAYVAHEMSKLSGVSSKPRKNIYVITPEFDRQGELVIRDNIKPMLEGKNVLVVLATAMSGKTIYKSIKCIQEYGGNVQGISVIFSMVDEIEGFPVHSVFDMEDLPDFERNEPCQCPYCKQEVPLTAVVTSYGYSVLENS